MTESLQGAGAPSAYILSLPKAELHLHLEGTVDPTTLAELSRRHPTPLSTNNNRYTNIADSGRIFTEEEARRLYQYNDFTGFLLAFKAVTERLRTAEDYELVTYRMMQKLHAQNVLHAEVYVSVGVIHWRGGEFAPLFEGLERGRKRGERDFGMSLYWIFDAVRHFGTEAADRVLDESLALRKISDSIVGIGLGGDERRATPELFRDVYARAGQAGLCLTVHAGETVGPESVWSALRELRADRIGHGLHATDDPDLVRYLADRQVPVEACITSNVLTGCCAALERHPLRKLFDAGVLVTLNTDDPDMFRTSLLREYQIAQDEFGFADAELKQLAINSFRASFLLEEKKREFLAKFQGQAATTDSPRFHEQSKNEICLGGIRVNPWSNSFSFHQEKILARHIGIVACSAEGAALCYRTICDEAPVLMGRHMHPEITMHTHCLGEYMEYVSRNDWQGVADLMLSSADKLAKAGAEFLISPDNTIHHAFDLVASRSPLPWLHIVDEVSAAAKSRGYRKLGITGTKSTMEGTVYQTKLPAAGFEYVVPDAAARTEIDRIIMDELVNGNFMPESRTYFQQVIGRMSHEGCDAVVLGCTEIPLLIDDISSPLPTLDSTRILARAALRRALA